MMNSKTTYEEFAYQRATYNNLRYLATSILASAIEDADVEFLENDYDEWKKLRLTYKKKSEILNELDLKKEFELKQNYKDMLCDIAEIYIDKTDIPTSILSEREKFEMNEKNRLSKITGYHFDTLVNIAKIHGWKIGCKYEEPTIFDL